MRIDWTELAADALAQSRLLTHPNDQIFPAEAMQRTITSLLKHPDAAAHPDLTAALEAERSSLYNWQMDADRGGFRRYRTPPT